MSKTDYTKIISGEPLKTIVRVKPPSNYLREDIKIMGTNLSLLDANNRLLEEFDAREVYGPEFSLQQIFDTSLTPYLNPFIQGFSVSIFAFGSSGTGKTQTIEGNKKEPGLILLFSDSLFNLLENKKYHTNIAKNSQTQNFSYGIRMRYVEVIDEELNDLLAGGANNYADPLQVVFHEWEGPTISNASWISVTNSNQLNEVFLNGQRNRNSNSNEFGKFSDKATTIFTLELIQTLELADTKENLILISKLNFFDLPGSDILLEDPESLRVRQGNTMNKAIISLATVLKDLASTKSDYVYYENSAVSHLMKDTLGGNCLSIGVFTIQNGDLKGSSLTLNYMKYARKIVNFPVVNDSKALGLLKKYRSEIIISQSSTGKGKLDTGDGYNYKIVELEKKLIEDNLDKMRNADEKSRLAQKLAELREKYNQLVKGKADLQAELIKSEEEKLEVSKALVELQIENTKIMEMLQNEKYDANNKLLNAEGDILSMNMKEEQAFKQISDLQDRIRDLLQEKREIEIEFVALKKNFITANADLEAERKKNENIGVELINVVNENRALHEEINDIYKKSGNTNDENTKFILKIERLDKENQELREAIIFSKAEIERLKTEMIKYDIMDQQHKLDLDNRKIELEKSMLDINREKNDEVSKIYRETENANKKVKDDKMLWESQKIEMHQKNKLYQRKVDDMEERINELIKMNEELHTDNTKMTIQLDEMRSVYRGKLLQFMNEQMNDKGDGAAKKISMKLGYDMNAREELIRSYNEKEILLNETIEKEKATVKNNKMEMKALKNYARNLKYLAEDWAPVGIPLPEILKKAPPIKLDDDNAPGYVRNQDEEVEKLKRRNRKLEEEIKILQDQLMNQTNVLLRDEKDIQKRIVSEIEFLKGKPEILERPGTGDVNVENLRKERNELQEENRRLVGILKDNKKWDPYLLQRENDKLMKMLKEYESGDSVGPISGDSKNLKQKLGFYEKTVKQLEKERSELIVRCTMAEEQLKNMQEHLNKSTQEYQRKIIDLKKQVKGKI